MATREIGKLVGIGRSLATHRLSLPRSYSLWVPDYLETGKSKIPLYSTINLQLKSFAFPVLESYQKFIDVLAENLDIDVQNSWAFPPKCYKIEKFKPGTSAIADIYQLMEYQRNIQIEVSATQYPILLRALEGSLPEGITLTISYYNPIAESKRYVPDTDLLSLKEELQSIGTK